MTEKLTLDVPEAAERLGVHHLTLRDAIRKGQVPSVKVGRRVLVPVKALEEWLAASARKPA